MGRRCGALLSIVSIVVEIFTALLLTPLVIKSFGQAEYGVYTLVISITSYLALLDLGVGNSVIRFMSKYRVNNQLQEQKKFLGITTVYYVVVAIICLIIGVSITALFPGIFAKGLSTGEIALSQKLVLILTVNVAVTIGTTGFFNVVAAYENHFISKGVSLVINVARVVLTVITVKLGVRSIGVVTINTAATIIIRIIIVGYVLFVMRLKPTLKQVDMSQIKEIVAYSAIILTQMIATQINSMADQILIGALTVASSVVIGVYGVGANINHYFQMFGQVFNGVLMPGVVKMIESGATTKELQNEMIRIGRMNFAFLGFIWCVFLIFGKQFVVLWSGNENAEAFYVAAILMFPFLFILSQSIGTQILWAMNKHKLQAYLKMMIVLVNVGLTIMLIRWNVLFGAVIGTFISLMLGDVLVMQMVFKKDIGISLKAYYRGLLKGIFPSLIISTFMGVLFGSFNLQGWAGFVINCVVMGIVYCICMTVFGFNAAEKRYIEKMCQKITYLFKTRTGV